MANNIITFRLYKQISKIFYAPQEIEDYNNNDNHLYNKSKAKYVFDDAWVVFKLLPCGHLVALKFVVWHTDVLGAYITALQSTAH